MEGGSVHLQQFLDPGADWRDDDLAAKWQAVRAARRVVTGALEIERREKSIGASLDAAVTVHAEGDAAKALSGLDLPELFITSDASLGEMPAAPDAFRLAEVPGVAVQVARAAGTKCERCWRVREDVGAKLLCGRCEKVVDG